MPETKLPSRSIEKAKGPAPADRDDFLNPFDDRVLLEYYEEVFKWHGYIRFLGLPHLRENPDVPIHRLFVEPWVSERHIHPDTPPSKWPECTSIINAISNSQRLVLLGDPGSGKSTLVNWLAWQFTRWEYTEWFKRLGQLVPVPLILRELKIDSSITWDGLLESFLTHPVGRPLGTQDRLHDILNRGQGLLLLDGLDEIGDKKTRAALRSSVLEGFHRYAQCRWLLTSRIVGYEEMPFDRADATMSYPGMEQGEVLSCRSGFPGMEESGMEVSVAKVYYVAPFNDGRIQRFALNWFAQREQPEVERRRRAEDFLKAVCRSPDTHRLARIPNLLTIMALVFRITAQLPNGRALLYDLIAEAYLQSIDQFRGLKEVPYSLAEKKSWLAYVAFEMQRHRKDDDNAGESSRREILATRDEVRGWITQSMRYWGHDASESVAERFIDYIGRRSGLLLPRSEDQFAFLHLSFQEYFAACFLQNQIASPDWLMDGEDVPEGAKQEDLRDYGGKTVWRETLVFLIELLAASEQPKWLKPVRKTLFGDDFAEVETGDEAQRARAALLARLAVDPHAGFSGDERRRAVEACCRWEAREQKRLEGRLWEHNNEVLRVLLGVDSASERRRALEMFVSVAKDLYLVAVSLDGTRLDDLSPLVGLSSLRQLDLPGTPVSDVSPLAGLSSLQILNLSGTPVSDVSPLAGLSSLRYLYLQGTQVSDVSPLARLSSLRAIYLSGTQVSDVSALAGLSSLQGLNLQGTPVSDVSPLAGLKKVTIFVDADKQVTVPKELEGKVHRP